MQTYATQEIIKKMEHDPILINYCSSRFKEENRINDEFLRFTYKNKNNPVIKSLFYIVMSFSIKGQEKCFESFLRNNVSLTREYNSIDELCENPPCADIYCTGSDQVWNLKTNGFFERPFYLDFGDKTIRRIAFSASFGRDSLEKSEIKQIYGPLKRYSAIGVRESSGLSILKELDIDECENTLDPTLMLDVDEWKKMTSETSPFKEGYILIYEFNKSSNIGEYAKVLSKRTGLPIKRITYWYHERHKGEECVVLPSVNEFMTLIRHAEYVITNSFHATVFATIFRKKFAVVYPKHFSVRLEDFLKLTEMKERHVKKIEDIGSICNEIDFDRVHSIIQNERRKTLLFFKKQLDE